MGNPDERHTSNILLDTLSADDLALLQPHLTREKLSHEQVLVFANRPIEHVWFPEGGVASVVADTADNGRTEVGIFGRDGFAGTPLLLGADSSQHETFIQVDGHTGLRIEAARFRAAVDQSVTLRTTLLRYVQTFITQTAHSAVSNAHQRIEARLARWLLMCHDRVIGDELTVTHDFLSFMLGVQRTTVTLALQLLEGNRLIKARRGRIGVLDRTGLLGVAGDSCGVPEAEYLRLIEGA